jgi:glycosyltransferase involved in cell wall biosynthesis
VLLGDVARHLPERTFRIVASSDNARVVGPLPANVRLDVDVPFGRIRERLLRARVVALPVRENTYSGATTTLLQAMACAKPVVVTRTAAIARGYHLEDGVNCRLVAPGDIDAFEHAVEELHGDASLADELGRRARETVERHLTWAGYTREVGRLLADAADRKASAA